MIRNFTEICMCFTKQLMVEAIIGRENDLKIHEYAIIIVQKSQKYAIFAMLLIVFQQFEITQDIYVFFKF